MRNEKQTFKDILSMIISACNREFYSGAKDAKETVIECATKIYIAQMKGDNNNDS